MRSCFCIIFIFFIQNPAVADGAFGIDIGQSVTELDAVKEGNKPALNSVPNPHPAFDEYSVWHTENTGVCIIFAYSKVYDDDRYGKRVKSDFEKFSTALAKKYGDFDLIDRRSPGGIWDELDEWVMSIKQNELVYAATWDNPVNAARLGYIELRVLALSSDSSFLKLMYKGDNENQCVDEIETSENSSF